MNDIKYVYLVAYMIPREYGFEMGNISIGRTDQVTEDNFPDVTEHVRQVAKLNTTPIIVYIARLPL